MQYIVFGVAILCILIVLDKWINRNAKKEMITILEDKWGKINKDKLSEEEVKKVKFYFEHTKRKYDIDEITWNDLDMDSIYTMMNNTNSHIGREYLYAMLRRLDFDMKSLEEKNKLIEMFSKNKKARKKIQLALCNIGNQSDISIYEYLTRFNKVQSRSCLINKIQDLLLILAIVLIIINNKFGLILGFVMIAINVGTYYVHKARIAPYLSFFSYIVRMNKSIDNICKVDSKELEPYQKELKDIEKKLSKLRKRSYLLSGSSLSGSFFEMVMDYIKMIGHVDIIKFYSMLEVIKENKDSIERMYEIVGMLDSLCAIASFRETLEYWSYPEFVDNGMSYKCEEVYHPLLDNPISNSLGTDKSILITGSNASGKSTFIRTLALNAVLSQTIYTSICRKYVAPFYQVYSSMALKDNLLGGESYYMVEIKSLKRILNADTKEYPVLCFIDEVLRGTNTLERIAASAHILGSIARNNGLCFAATHDIELTKILNEYYESYHFQEEVSENDIKFDYKLYEGSSKTRNAIKLLSIIGYDEKIVEDASRMAGEFLENGTWNVLK